MKKSLTLKVVIALILAAAEDKACLLQEEGEGWPRLVVFGDKDSKRRVKGVVRIEVE